MELQKLEQESFHQYIWRMDELIQSGKYRNWKEITPFVNKELFGEDESQYRDESAYRKGVKYARDYYEAGVFGIREDDYIKELQMQKRELAKQQVKTRDERNELNRIIREEARKESYKEQIIRSISDYQSSPLSYDEYKKFNSIVHSDNDLIISMTDLHTGIKIDNYFNKFNEDVLRDRLNEYLDKIFEVQMRHNSENAFVLLSEIVSGLIHLSLRIEANQNLIEQFLTATDYISQFLSELSYRFNTVNVFVCSGNHSRISAKKDESIKGENIDLLALPYLEAKLQNFKNIQFHKNTFEESIAIFHVRGNLVMSSHGDKDHPDTVVQKFTLLFGSRPALVYLGHRHTNGMSTVYNTKVIQSGCLSGTDNHALDLRLHSKPSQTISVITEKGLDCLYDVEFEN